MRKRTAYTKLGLRELQEATKQFDKEIPWEETRPMSPENERRFRRSQCASLAHRRSQKRKTVVVALDSMLVDQSDKYAAEHGLSRSEVIERSLQSALEFVGYMH